MLTILFTAVIQSCPCGHLQQRVTCGACTSNPVSKEQAQLKCVTECAQRQRNARLAEALGIKPTEKLVEYPAELKAFATANHHFVQTLEKTFNDFFMGPRQAVVLPHMPLSKRSFAINLAEIYRFGTELVDSEPNRSVSIRRRIDSRIPNPTLSSIVSAPTTKRQLGGLGDLKRTLTGTSQPTTAAPTPLAWGSRSPALPTNGLASAASSARPSPVPSPTIRAEPRSAPMPARLASSRSSSRPAAVRTASPAPVAPIDDSARDWDASDDEA
jgi:transcriptional repressor NF-X1